MCKVPSRLLRGFVCLTAKAQSGHADSGKRDRKTGYAPGEWDITKMAPKLKGQAYVMLLPCMWSTYNAPCVATSIGNPHLGAAIMVAVNVSMVFPANNHNCKHYSSKGGESMGLKLHIRKTLQMLLPPAKATAASRQAPQLS